MVGRARGVGGGAYPVRAQRRSRHRGEGGVASPSVAWCSALQVEVQH